MSKTILAAASAFALSACVNIDNPGDAPPPAPGDTCRAAPGQVYIGRTASAAVGAELLRATDSRELRWVAPDMVVTADYKFGRLTVTYDRTMTITMISCS